MDNNVTEVERGKGVQFHYNRRITGYITPALDNWNDAKKAEEKDRVKHSSKSMSTVKEIAYTVA